MPNEPAVRGYVVGPGEGVPDRTPDVKASGRSTGGSLTVMELAVAGGPLPMQDASGAADYQDPSYNDRPAAARPSPPPPMAQLRVSLGAKPADPPVSGEW